MRKKKWMNLAAIALASAMFATGCGSSAGSAAQATTQAAQTESSAEETDAQKNAEADGALVIKEQGIFTAGGTTVTSDGTFDPEDQWEETGAGQNFPISIYFGDYIDNGDPAIQATASWQGMRQTCYDFEEAYNAQGGNCKVVDLPKEGITGNDHFMFQDLNNDVIADHIENWIRENVK